MAGFFNYENTERDTNNESVNSIRYSFIDITILIIQTSQNSLYLQFSEIPRNNTCALYVHVLVSTS